MALNVWTVGTGVTGVGISNLLEIDVTAVAGVGDLVSGWATVQNNGIVNSVVDTKGNTWTIRSAFTSGASKYYWIDTILTSALAVGDKITITCSTAANRKLGVFFGISGQAASPFDKQGVGATGTSTTPTIAIDAPAQADSVILCATYWGLTTFSAEDPDYVWQVEVPMDSRRMHGAYRIVSSAAADTYAATLAASQQWDTNYIIYKGAGSAPPTAAGSNLALLGVG